MGTPYFGFKFTRVGKTTFAYMHINSDLAIEFIRPGAPIMQGHWRYVATYLETDRVSCTNTPLKPDGYWDRVIEMALHDQLLEGKVK